MNRDPGQKPDRRGDQRLRVLMTGGGTGGHIYPGLAVAEALSAAAPGSDLRFAGTRRGLEARLVPQAGYRLMTLPASGFRGLGLRARLVFGFNVLAGVTAALFQLVRWRPAVVLGTGGYVSVPALVAALLLGIPCALQEQNSVPGSANRLLGRRMRRIYLGFSSAGRFFRAAVCRDTGNPVRRSVVASYREGDETARAPGAPTRVLIFGGSGGAKTLNLAVMAAAGAWAAQTDRTFLVQTGPAALAEVTAACKAAANIDVVPYIEDMALALGQADLVICRAGAMTLAEIQCAGKPAILVPFPHATDDHQFHNAEDCSAAGAALVLKDTACDATALIALVDELLRDRPRLVRMGQAARAMARPEAARLIAEDLLSLAGHPAGRPLPARGLARSIQQDKDRKEGSGVR